VKDRDICSTPNMALRATLKADGGSRGNPGESGIGYTLTVASGDTSDLPRAISYGGWYIGRTTNNQAEYHALIWGLENALLLNISILDVELDSELVVRQINGEYRVRNAGIIPLHSLASELIQKFKEVSVRHVGRELNADSDALANAAMDNRQPVGNFHVEYVAPELLTAEGVVSSSPLTGRIVDKPAAGAADQNERKATVGVGTYYLRIKEHFDAAHQLHGYPGPCRNLHGHTWDVEVEVKGTKLDEVGIVYDFKDLKENLKDILDQYDHVFLNEVPPFDTFNPTAENLAREIYEQMEAKLPEGVSTVEVAVWESPIARLVYRVD